MEVAAPLCRFTVVCEDDTQRLARHKNILQQSTTRQAHLRADAAADDDAITAASLAEKAIAAAFAESLAPPVKGLLIALNLGVRPPNTEPGA